MEEQKQINEVISRAESLEYIQRYLENNPDVGRMELSAHLCDHFGFLDATGRRQTTTTSHGLRQLESTAGQKGVSPIFHAFKFSSGSIGLNVGMYGA